MPVLKLPVGIPKCEPMSLFTPGVVMGCICPVAIASSPFFDNTTRRCWSLVVLFLNVTGILLLMFGEKDQVKRDVSNKKNFRII